MVSIKYIKILQLINTVFLIGGTLCALYGGCTVPQNVSNSNKVYIGDAQQYNEELKRVQLASYEFKLVIIGLSICGGNILSLLLTCYCIRYTTNNTTIHPIPIQLPIERKVTINPTIIEIPNNIDKVTNIKKWVGNTVMPEDII